MLDFWQNLFRSIYLNSGIDEDETCGAVQISSSDKKCKGNPYKNGCVDVSKEETHNNEETNNEIVCVFKSE